MTETNQSTLETSREADQSLSLAEFSEALPEIASEIQEFAEAREWAQFHTPRNIVLALMGEVGELAELLQWKGDDIFEKDDEDPVRAKISAETLDKLSHELADVSIYLLRLCTVCDLVEPVAQALLRFDEAASSPSNL